MKHSRLTVKKCLFLLGVAVLCSACNTMPKEAPAEDLTDREIIQLAQTAYDKGQVKAAEYYYKVLLQRYGTYTESYIEGRFELAHLYIKKKRYEEAVPMLQEIIAIYDNSAPGVLPAAYRKLAQLDLAKVPEKRLAQIVAQQEKDRLAQEQYEAELSSSYTDYYGGGDYGADDSYYDDDYDEDEDYDEDYDDDEDGYYGDSSSSSTDGTFRFF